MTRRILRSIALVALLAVLPFGGNQRLAGQTSGPRFILCAPAAAVAGIAQRHGLTVVRPLDPHAHGIFLVTGPAGVASADLLSLVRADSAVTNFEPDTTRTLTETGFGLNQSTVAILDQSTVAILDALNDRTLVPFGDIDVWNGYINQPAASILRLPEAHAQFGTGAGVVALIDEGVDPNHTLLLPALLPGYDFTRNLPGPASEWLDLDLKLIAKLNQSTVAILDQSTVAILDGSSPAVLNQSTVAILDQSTVAILDTTQVPTAFGHGTMMAGAIRRAAPGANIMPLKAFTAGGTANLFDVIRAIYFGAENGAKVIVMGFSMPESSVELTHAINFATSKGAVLVAAAGNDGRETLVFPAALRSVIGVGSTSPTDQRSVFSNFGDALAKVGAPGESIITSYPGGRFAAASGTSFSAALVGGAVAMMQSVDPALTPAGVASGIGVGAVNGNVLKLGAGRVDVLAALQARAPTPTATAPPPSANTAPVAVNDKAAVAEDASITIDVRANDTDAEGDSLAVSAVTAPSHGTAVLVTSGDDAQKVTYKPAANFAGVDSFTYTVGDGHATSTAAVTVTVTGQNEVPVPAADVATTQEDTAVLIDVLGNDSDGDGEALTLIAASGGTRGTVAVEAGRVRYQPNPHAHGMDSFSYSVSDTRSGTASGTVTVTITAVNDAPAAANDSATGPEDVAIVVNVLANDNDDDGDTLSVTSVTQGTKGSVKVLADGPSAGSVSYSPAADFSGSDTFAYTIDDGNGGTATGVVTVVVNSVNDGPTAADDSVTTAEDTPLVVPATANDADPDGDALTVVAVSTPANGVAAANAGQVTYTPAENFAGIDTFTYTVADGIGGTATAAITVTVSQVDDAPMATDDTASGAEDAVIVVDAVANDNDPDGAAVRVASTTQPAHGSVELTAAGSLTYTPSPHFAGTDRFTYVVTDGATNSAPAAVTVTITPLNDSPAASPDVVTTAEDTAIVIQAAANDTDPDDDALSVAAVGAPAHGTTVLEAGQVTYTPAANFAGTDSFTYTVSDGNGGTATASVTVTIAATNDEPTAVDDVAATTGATPLVIDVTANDVDVDGDRLAVAAVSASAYGTAVIAAGQVTYTPGIGFAGTDTLTYTIVDGRGGAATGTLQVIVAAAPEAPGVQEY